MKIKRFVGRNMKEAIQKAKQELGPDALIISTRKIKSPSVFGGTQTEITVAQDSLTESPPPNLEENCLTKNNNIYHQADNKPSEITSYSTTDMKKDIIFIKQLLFELIQEKEFLFIPQLKKDFFKLYLYLIEKGVDEAVAIKLLKTLVEEKSKFSKITFNPENFLIDFLGNNIKITNGIERYLNKYKIFALIGPTGVGKTTTIAKLAARYSIESGAKVGLITLDTYRIAAVEQLKIYAGIMGLDLEIIHTHDEWENAIKKFCNMDIIFVDTAGHSQKNEEYIFNLKTFFRNSKSVHISLLISATSDKNNIRDIINSFGILLPENIIFTKIDEVCNLGSILNISHWSNIPISYLTNGQNVPDDIIEAEKTELAKMILL